MGGNAGEHVAQISKWVDLVALAGGDEAEEDGRGVTAVVGAAEEPVLPSDRDPSQGVLGGIVIDGQVAVGHVNGEGVPLVEDVGDGLAHGAFREDRPATSMPQAPAGVSAAPAEKQVAVLFLTGSRPRPPWALSAIAARPREINRPVPGPIL